MYDETVSGRLFTYNLRFPGQYFDVETGKHYNYKRDYDPSIGRYIQSDPLGLAAGTNTFGYVGGNPLLYYDPRGENPAVGCLAGLWAGPVGCGVGALGSIVLIGGAAIIMSSIGSDSSKSGSSSSSTTKTCPPDKPNCQEHFTRCLGTSMADLPGGVYGSSRCLLCRDACVRGGGNWPDIAMTSGAAVRCDYWSFK